MAKTLLIVEDNNDKLIFEAIIRQFDEFRYYAVD